MTITYGNQVFSPAATAAAIGAASPGTGNSYSGFNTSSSGTTPGVTASYISSVNPKTLNPSEQSPSTGGWSGAVTPPSGQVPWWLNPNTVNGSIKELRKVFRGTGEAFDVSGTIANLQNVINQNFNTGLVNADSAAKEAGARANQQGGFVNTSLIRGQAAYDAFQQKERGTLQAGQYGDTARQAEFAAKADLAKAIASIRAQYAQQLAAFSLGKDQQQQSREEFYQTLGANKDQFRSNLALQLRQLDDAQTAASAASGSNRSRGAGGVPLATGLPTIFSSNGLQPSFAGMDVNRNDAADKYISYLKQLGLV